MFRIYYMHGVLHCSMNILCFHPFHLSSDVERWKLWSTRHWVICSGKLYIVMYHGRPIHLSHLNTYTLSSVFRLTYLYYFNDISYLHTMLLWARLHKVNSSNTVLSLAWKNSTFKHDNKQQFLTQAQFIF